MTDIAVFEAKVADVEEPSMVNGMSDILRSILIVDITGPVANAADAAVFWAKVADVEKPNMANGM